MAVWNIVFGHTAVLLSAADGTVFQGMGVFRTGVAPAAKGAPDESGEDISVSGTGEGAAVFD